MRFRHITPFWSFTAFTPTIPKLYWDVRSQEQRILNLFELLNKIICYADYLGKDVDELAQMLDEMARKLDDPEFFERYIALLQNWLDEHMPEIIGRAAQMVFFGLTDDGRFCAYIPRGYAWDDIEFDTGANYGHFDYGRLILRYNVEGSGVIDNTGVYYDTGGKIIELESRIARTERTLYTPMAEGGNL